MASNTSPACAASNRTDQRRCGRRGTANIGDGLAAGGNNSAALENQIECRGMGKLPFVWRLYGPAPLCQAAGIEPAKRARQDEKGRPEAALPITRAFAERLLRTADRRRECKHPRPGAIRVSSSSRYMSPISGPSPGFQNLVDIGQHSACNDCPLQRRVLRRLHHHVPHMSHVSRAFEEPYGDGFKKP